VTKTFMVAQTNPDAAAAQLANNPAVKHVYPVRKMHMVLDPVDRLRDGLQSAGCATQVFMKSGAPVWANKRTAVLRAEHNVIMKAKKCRTHNPILLL